VADLRAHWQYWLLGAWLIVVFLLGGSSRADVPGLLVLRPLSVLVLAAAVSGLSRRQIAENRFLLGVAAAWLALHLLQLVPLPPAIWHALPDREVVREVDRQAGLGAPWRPLSMSPWGTRNALWATVAPLAVLVLALQVGGRELRQLLVWILAIVLASAALGMLQMSGDAQGPLYFYAYTHNGLPVGLMANRNHQALLLACALPMLAALAMPGDNRTRRFGSAFPRFSWAVPAVGALILVPLILLTGSRSGTLLAVIALAGVALFVWLAASVRAPASDATSSRHRRRGALVALAGIALAGAVTLALGRTPAIDRFASMDPTNDLRIRVLPVILSMIRTYLPWGTGFGAFENVYRLHEPDALLSSFYLNHVHDDWLELVLTGGLPALLLLAVGLVAFGRRSIRVLSARAGGADNGLAVVGFMIILLLGLASITDYPLRVPSLACLGAIALVWLQAHPERDQEDARSG
jgi:O-antigen ligase